MIPGVDYRYWVGTRFPSALGFQFAYGKITDGSWKPDDPRHVLLEHQRRACKQQRLPHGGFIYWRYGSDPIYQVDLFAAKLLGVENGPDYKSLPAALDFEDPFAKGKRDAGRRIFRFVEEAVKVFAGLGRCLSYCRKSWWDGVVDPQSGAAIAMLTDLWVANGAYIPRDWSDYVMEQRRLDVVVPGVSSKLDFDYARESWLLPIIGG